MQKESSDAHIHIWTSKKQKKIMQMLDDMDLKAANITRNVDNLDYA